MTEAWRRSSFCADNACVEVLRVGEFVMVRDSKDPGRLPLRFSETEWRTFTRGVRNGEFE